MCKSLVASLVLTILLSSGSAFAQEKGQIGLTMSYPTAVGLVWQVTDRLAVRPGISFSRGWSESRSESDAEVREGLFGSVSFSPAIRSSTTSDSWSIGVDLGVQWSLGQWDNVRTYIAPAYGYRQTETTTVSTLEYNFPAIPGFPSLPPEISGPRTQKLNSSSHVGNAMFGVQFTPHRRFGAIGEVGVRYTRSGLPFLGLPEESRREGRSETIGLAAGVGVIFYFK